MELVHLEGFLVIVTDQLFQVIHPYLCQKINQRPLSLEEAQNPTVLDYFVKTYLFL